MFPAHTLPPFFIFILWSSCVETNDYPMTSFRNAADLQFQTAASYDNFDMLNEATIAAQVAALPTVRNYAATLITDRRAAQAALKKIADSVNQQLPQQPQSGDLDVTLARISGSALDTAYLREAVMDQDSAIALYQDEIANGSYMGLIHYALVYLPLMQSRRATADSLLRVLEGH